VVSEGKMTKRRQGSTYKNPELIEQLRGTVVVAAAVLELAKVVESVDHVVGNAVVLLEVVQVGNLVAAEVVDDILVGQEILDLAALLLELFPLVQGFLPLLNVFLRSLVEAVDLSVQVADKVGHVGVLQQLKLEPRNVAVGRLILGLLDEL